MLYLGLNDTKRGRPRKSQANSSKQKVSSGMISSYTHFLVTLERLIFYLLSFRNHAVGPLSMINLGLHVLPYEIFGLY